MGSKKQQSVISPSEQLLNDLEKLYSLRAAFDEYTKLEASVKERMKTRKPGRYGFGPFTVVVSQRKGRMTYNPPEAWTKKYDKLMVEREKYAVEGEPVLAVSWNRGDND